jgi:Na+/H+ antiporter NhaD/arsenite permease-like protein
MMDNMLQKIIDFIKKETVLTIATVLAVVSAFWVHPGRQYVGYIDWRVLGILLSLMLIVAGFQSNGLFDAIGSRLLAKTKNTAQLMLVLVFLCFFSSMFITNDVALLTFVPFACTILQKCHQERLIVTAFVLQTLAANLGSMLTPIGNPQNLYLYGKTQMSAGTFILLMLPYSLVSLLLLMICVVIVAKRSGIEVRGAEVLLTEDEKLEQKKYLLPAYLLLFVLCLLTVAHMIPYPVTLGTVALAVLLLDRGTLIKVDYSLLLTFVGFFIFIGNMGRMPAFCDFLQKIIGGREVMTAVIASQVISNVPAALLLSGFTENITALIIGTNLGGLGTLIASMASLISYKQVARQIPGEKKKYFGWFTIANIVFLMILVLENCLL